MDMLPVIENVVKTMNAKDVRTIIMICNDRLDALGEEQFQPATQKPKTQGAPRRGRKPMVMKAVPMSFDGMRTFKDLTTPWVNISDMGEGGVAVASIGYDKKTYAIVEKRSGTNEELNGVKLTDLHVQRVHSDLSQLG